MRDQRIELIAEHGNAIADDEVRFHIQHIIQRYQEISSQRHPASIVQYLFFEPLVFTCWESIGRTISARWCERNEVVRTRGAQVLTAFLLDNHWFPFWWVPNGDCLTFHTAAHETVDAHKFRDVCACIGQQLGFPLFALHVMPSPLPCHDMCGTFAMMFHAHVVHGAILPTTLGDLSNLHANMRAVFVADLYTKLEVPAPVSWGNGTMPGESGCGGEAGSFCSVHDLPWHFRCTHCLQAKIIAHIVESIRNMFLGPLYKVMRQKTMFSDSTGQKKTFLTSVHSKTCKKNVNLKNWKTPNYLVLHELEGRSFRNF